jgi:alkanesulfonate monooxygenase SsuD/methylene tetrahydromethanopterin reductase-like flavin-dependent oxidoreductase (luciferase family)
MEVAIGLPNAVKGTEGSAIVEWARRAESAGFSSLGTIDRIVYPNYESLIALAAAAAVTERIGLITSVLIAPLRSAALLAKQAVSVDNISGGRLTMGLAVGGREDDYAQTGATFERRGKIFDRQLEEIEKLWAGEDRGTGNPVVPAPVRAGGPSIVTGGQAERSFARAARYGSGWVQGGGGPDAFAESLPALEKAWSDAGRDGQPRKLALAYFSLGPNAEQDAQDSLADYYAFLGPFAEQIAAGAVKTAADVKALVSAYEGHGCDELILFPSSGDPAQVDLLHDAL